MVSTHWPVHYERLCDTGFVWNLNGSNCLHLLERNQHANLEERLMPLRMSEYNYLDTTQQVSWSSHFFAGHSAVVRI